MWLDKGAKDIKRLRKKSKLHNNILTIFIVTQ